jgi:hypothetical protein
MTVAEARPIIEESETERFKLRFFIVNHSSLIIMVVRPCSLFLFFNAYLYYHFSRLLEDYDIPAEAIRYVEERCDSFL